MARPGEAVRGLFLRNCVVWVLFLRGGGVAKKNGYFFIWVLVIVGGSGNNFGAIRGGFGVWFLWI